MKLRVTDDLPMVGTKIHNSYRAMRFTVKGRKIGNPEKWNTFSGFFEDMGATYIDGYRLARINKSKPHSKENSFWCNPNNVSGTRDCVVYLEYNGESLTLSDWAKKLELPYNGIKKRYYAKGYSTEEILFGRIKKKRIWNKEDLIRTRASKLLAAYRVRDFKRGQEFSVRKDWFIENILSKPCNYCGDTSRIGADRINNKLGHIESNLIPCCHICNGIRGDRFTVDEMRQIGNVVKSIKSRWN